MKITVCIVLGMLFMGFSLFADARGDEIAQKHFALTKSADSSATATMTIIGKAGSKKIRKLEMFTKNGATGKNTFINFLEPADVAGTKFLTLAQKGGDSEQRLYLPALKKTRKISSSSKDGEFVNSDLWYYDMEERTIDDCSYTFLAENETSSDKALAGMKFYKIEMKAKAANSPYAKTVAWISMDNYAIYKIECFDKKDNSLLKSILFAKIENVQGVLIPTQTAVTNLKKGSTTLLQLLGLKINTGLKDEIFSVKNLEQ